MKKSTFLKITLAFAFAVMVLGVNAQIYDNATNRLTVEENTQIEFVTVGYKMPYGATPDPIYSPQYQADGTLNANMTWTWGLFTDVNGTNPVGAGVSWSSEDGATANLKNVTYNTAGSYYLGVVENSALYGGCGTTMKTIQVEVVPEPTITIDTWFADAPDASTPGFRNEFFNGGTEKVWFTCKPLTAAAGAAQTITTTLTGYGKNYVKMSIFGAELETDGTDTEKASGQTSTVLNAVSTPLAVGTALDATNPANSRQVTGTPTSLGTYDFPFLNDGTNDVRTKYTITIYPHTRDDISLKSDKAFNAAAAPVWFPAAATAQTFYIVLNPAPKTGPIYHLPNA